MAEGQRQETSEEAANLRTLIDHFLLTVKATLQNAMDNFIDTLTNHLTLKFCISEDVVQLFKEFSDGSIDDDNVLLGRIDGIIRRMAGEKADERWKEEEAKEALDTCLRHSQSVSANYLDELMKSIEAINKHKSPSVPPPPPPPPIIAPPSPPVVIVEMNTTGSLPAPPELGINSVIESSQVLEKFMTEHLKALDIPVSR